MELPYVTIVNVYPISAVFNGNMADIQPEDSIKDVYWSGWLAS